MPMHETERKLRRAFPRPVALKRPATSDGPDISGAPAQAVLRLQTTVGNRAVNRLLAGPGPAALRSGAEVVRRTWTDKGGGSYYEDETLESYNSAQKKLTDAAYQSRLLSNAEHLQLMALIQADLNQGQAPVVAPVDVQPEGGGTIDFGAVRAALALYYNDGQEMAPSEWRAMRQALSNAVELPNKSHPAHGSNFNKPQRAVQQVKDWAKPLPPAFRVALSPAIDAQFGPHIL